MALIVQKYGGTSVGSPDRIKNVARKVAKFRAAGHQVVVVVSAMSGETNRLIALTKEVAANPSPRELDVVVSTGEQVTIGLLCMALADAGVARLVRAARHAPAPALRHHRARHEHARRVEPHHDPRRPRDLRVRHGARVRAAPLSRDRSGDATHDSARHQSRGLSARTQARPRALDF